MTLEEIVRYVEQSILNPVVTFLFVLASLLFIWGVIQFWVAKGGDPEGVATGRRHIVWGAVGLIIMSSAYGILNLIASIYEDIN